MSYRGAERRSRRAAARPEYNIHGSRRRFAPPHHEVVRRVAARGCASPRSPHPEEPRSGVSKDVPQARWRPAQCPALMVRDGAARLLTMRSCPSRCTKARASPRSPHPEEPRSGVLKDVPQARWRPAQCPAFMVRDGASRLLTMRSCGGRVAARGCASPRSPHPEEPRSGVSKDVPQARRPAQYPARMVRDGASRLLTMRRRTAATPPAPLRYPRPALASGTGVTPAAAPVPEHSR
jgi:hypothetical protein